MKKTNILAIVLICICINKATYAQQTFVTPASLSIPNKLETSIGTLEFKDGAPNAATVQKLYDNLDFLHAQNVFLNTFQGASTYALGEGFHSGAAEDNTFLIFSDLMDSKSLFL